MGILIQGSKVRAPPGRLHNRSAPGGPAHRKGTKALFGLHFNDTDLSAELTVTKELRFEGDLHFLPHTSTWTRPF